MAWDGIYRAKNHHGVRARRTDPVVITCGRRFARRWTSDPAAVNCFACLGAMRLLGASPVIGEAIERRRRR